MEIQTQLLHKHFHSLLVCLRCPSHLYNIHKITCSLFFFVPSQFNKFFVEASSYIHNSHYNQTSSTSTIHRSSSCSTSKLLRVFLRPHKDEETIFVLKKQQIFVLNGKVDWKKTISPSSSHTPECLHQQNISFILLLSCLCYS